MTGASATWTAANIGIYGYGSLLDDAGPQIEPRIIDRVRALSPWPIEYARRSKRRGGAPTLTIYPAGSNVGGALLILDLEVDCAETVREWLWDREGRPKRTSIKVMPFLGLSSVVYAGLEPNISETDMTADSLARLAIKSVSSAGELNGIRYLAANIARGIITPLTFAYRDAILKLMRADDLAEAETLSRSIS